MKDIDMEEQLLSAVLALPEAERERYLERACAGDERMQERMHALLEACAASTGFLDDLPRLAPLPPSEQEAAMGEHLGNYRVLQELGEGGCGRVYLAEQLTPVRREVALKVIKPGMDTRAVIARFTAERQALALMNHPNIAQVLDAGATPAGRPYFVMELVHGVRITQYCAQARLDIGERLELFIQVCQAIQHAHQRGIIHRDIKPSNVLVTQHDGVPLVKVIDFGIAKALSERLTEQTLYTAFEPLIGTPAYMSPEQTRADRIEVDTRSDIYSLGVLLYELLTGDTPFDTQELAGTSLEALKQRIREEEPPTPSKRLSTLQATTLSETARQYRLSGDKLIKLVHRDLDWIVMRCLEKTGAHRYQTVHDLVLEISRYLRHEPVVARPPSLLYTLRKFARRHRVAFAAGTAIVVALLVATAVSAWSAVQANRARQLAAIEADNHQEVIDFLQNDLLAQASPEHQPDRELKLRTVLDRASEKIESRFAGQPLVEALIRHTLAQTYNSLGEYARAREHAQAELEIYHREFGGEHPKTLELMSYLGGLWMQEGNQKEAQALAVRALELQRHILGPEHKSTLITSGLLASIYRTRGHYDAAVTLDEQVLAARRRVFGPESRETLVTMLNLAGGYYRQGKIAQAVELQEQEYAITRRARGIEHPETLTSMGNLALMYKDLGRFADAAALCRTTLEASTRILGPTHPETLNRTLTLGNILLDMGDLEQAERVLAQLLPLTVQVFGEEHSQTSKVRHFLAAVYHARGRMTDALRLAQSTLEIVNRTLGERHPASLVTASGLARIYESGGELQAAEALLRDSVARAPDVFGAAHPTTWLLTDQHAGVLLKLQRYDLALDLSRRSLQARQRFSAGDWRTLNVKSQLGAALAGLGRVAEAEPLLREAHAGLLQQQQMIPASYAQVLKDSAARNRAVAAGA